MYVSVDIMYFLSLLFFFLSSYSMSQALSQTLRI